MLRRWRLRISKESGFTFFENRVGHMCRDVYTRAMPSARQLLTMLGTVPTCKGMKPVHSTCLERREEELRIS